MLHLKYIPIQDYKNSTEKAEYQYLYKKGDDNQGIAEYGNDLLICKIISDKSSANVIVYLHLFEDEY